MDVVIMEKIHANEISQSLHYAFIVYISSIEHIKRRLSGWVPDIKKKKRKHAIYCSKNYRKHFKQAQETFHMETIQVLVS
jgi:hypothetical protein